LGGRAAAKSENIDDDTVAYLQSIVDPFPPEAAVKIPQREHQPSVCFQVKDTVTVSAVVVVNGPKAGDHVMVGALKGGIYSHFACTGHTVLTSWFDRHNQFPTAPVVVSSPTLGGQTMTELAAGGGASLPAGTYAVTQYDSCRPAPEIYDAFTCYRIVSKGIRIRYAGAPLAASGTLAVALLPGSSQIAGNISVAVAGIMSGVSGPQASIDYDYVKNLQGAMVYPAIDGATITWRPTGDGIEDWRPMKFIPSLAHASVGSTTLGLESTPPIDGEPALCMAQREALCHPVYSGIVGGTNMYDNPAVVNNAWIGMTQQCDPNDPTIVFGAEGLDPTARFELDWVVNYEAITDSRPWSLAQPSHAYGEETHLARLVAAKVPNIHPGTSSSLGSKFRAFGHKLFTGVKKAYSGFKAARPMLDEVLGQLGVPSIGDAFAALTGSEGMAEAAAAIGAIML
jgi:hypothetical protein